MPGPDNKVAIKLFRRIREARARGVECDGVFISQEDFKVLTGNQSQYTRASISGVIVKPLTVIQP